MSEADKTLIDTISQAQNGSREAFARLLEDHYDTIYRFAYRKVIRVAVQGYVWDEADKDRKIRFSVRGDMRHRSRHHDVHATCGV